MWSPHKASVFGSVFKVRKSSRRLSTRVVDERLEKPTAFHATHRRQDDILANVRGGMFWINTDFSSRIFSSKALARASSPEESR